MKTTLIIFVLFFSSNVVYANTYAVKFDEWLRDPKSKGVGINNFRKNEVGKNSEQYLHSKKIDTNPKDSMRSLRSESFGFVVKFQLLPIYDGNLYSFKHCAILV